MRRPVRTLAALIAALLFLPVPAGSAEAPHDILLIVLDDLGVDRLEVYGEAGACSTDGSACALDEDCLAGQSCVADVPATPAIDQLALDGVLFRNAWATPSCSPTRATLLTGRHGFRTGVLAVGDALPAIELTLAETLDDPFLGSAHAQAAFGKWHLGGGRTGPNDQGFETYIGDLRGGVGDYFNWDRTVNGTTEDCFAGSAACPVDAWAPTVNVNDALAWIGSQTGPWFVYLGFNAPHAPFHVPPHDLVSGPTLARLPQASGQPAPAGTDCNGPFRAVCYMAMLEAVDTEIGRLLGSLTEPVTVILLGDNGTPGPVTLAPFDPARAKGSPYEGGVNVPLIIRHAAGLSAGEVSDALVHSADLFATILDLAGAARPGDRAIDGLSLVPLLNDPQGKVRERIDTDAATSRAVRDARFKLIRRAGFDELYDLAGDPPSTPGDPFETADLLLGHCSSTTAAICHGDADCPAGESCIVAPLPPVTATALAGLRLADALTLASCDPLLCPGALTCASGTALSAGAGTGDSIDLNWVPVPGATVYDVIRGPIGVLRASSGDFAVATESCLADDLGVTTLTDGAAPSPGEIFWYLVRAAGAPCNGTWGDGTGLTGLRDWRIAASPVTCSD